MEDHQLEKFNEALLSSHLRDEIKKAEAGDEIAARGIIQSIAILISTSNVHPVTKEPMEIPGYVRDYLSKALCKASLTLDANKAFNLKKTGRPSKYSSFEKRLAASVLFQFIMDGQSVLQSALDAADIINNETSDLHVWKKFQSHPIDAATLQTWYYAYKVELEALYQASRICKTTD
ncbi:hypothetical protein [Chromobacterium sp. ASV23]|uniref:hypothetical protein n=1 Tax=Chromobacterium sp. ASV23 TaxID=2795110 RepID=UPI0018EBEE12|nr:hypothetical protein [Chromobacterium sp. ASV23]